MSRLKNNKRVDSLLNDAVQIYYNQEKEQMAQEFTTKDSGKRQEFVTGMKRDIQTDKPRYDLIGSGWDLIKRWAELVGRGALKYGELNFEKAATEEEYRRFRSSAMRHMVQWFQGETDEDHAAAVCFNLAGAEMVRTKLGRIDEKKGLSDADINAIIRNNE